MRAARHTGTLFSVFRPAIRKADLRDLRSLVTLMITTELEQEGLPHQTFGPLPSPVVVVAKPASRHTIGHIVPLQECGRVSGSFCVGVATRFGVVR